MVGGQTLQGIVTNFKFLWYYKGQTYPSATLGAAAVIDLELFIPEEIAIAPKHPLAQNLDLPLPDANRASSEEIREIQRRDRIPGVVKRIIPFDANTFWEYWWCVPGRLLLAEDVEVMVSVLL
jgi:hypothetical protein